MMFRKSCFQISLCMFLLVSCQRTGTSIIDIESPQDVIISPESTLRIGIIGDSISSFKGSSPSDLDGYTGEEYKTFYPRGDVKRVENMWWYKVAQAFGVTIENVCNCSWSGSRVTGNSSSETSASAGCSTKRINDLSFKGIHPDVVLCYISCNDWAFNVPLGNWSSADEFTLGGGVSTFREAYALMISKIKEHYPSCLIVCLTNLDDPQRDYTPGWPTNNKNGVSVDEWNKNIKELSKAFGCLTIDLQDCGLDYYNVSNYSVDAGLHPNDAGMTMIANKVIKELASTLEF